MDPSAKKVIVLMVDGTSTAWSQSDALAYRDRSKALNAEVVVVTTKDSFGEDLKKVTRQPDQNVVVIESNGNGKDDVTDLINTLIVDTNGMLSFIVLCSLPFLLILQLIITYLSHVFSTY